MMQDEEFEVLLQTPERIKALGFKPQKEILLNHLLPYANELDEESSKFLELVKLNFAKSVILREMKPACGMWSSRLMKYIRIYGFKFGKEDHIALIKLTYELVLIPDLEPCKIHKFATLFLMLTKKRYLLTPEELTLPWRPLYDVGKKIFDKSATHFGLYHYLPTDTSKEGEGAISMVRKLISGNVNEALDLFGLAGPDENELPTHLEGSYVAMVKCARPYFEISATQEILEECLPQINPCSTDSHLVTTLAAFLPVSLHPKDKDRGHGLWFDKLMELWECCYNSQCGTADLMTLFAGLAKKSPGSVDWSPYVSKMFTRFLHALNLPVSYKDMQYTRNHNLDTKSVATWIIWSICPDGVTLKHLRSFLAAIESYLHSVNSGRWTFRLRDLLRKLAREFLNRVRREREPRFQTGWENQSPETYRLRDEDITEFVKIMLDPTLQAVYSRGGSLDISLALQNLANLRPAMVIPPLLDRLKTTLTSLTEPHRVTAAMSAVASVARPMLRGADADYPEGPTHVVPLLLAILPGLDPNDIKKTLVSLHFILMFCWMVPLIDCSSAVDYYDDLTEEELITCESTAQFEDFVLVFLDRIFTIIESSVQEQARLDTKDSEQMRSKMDAVMETAISSATTAVLMQCSPKIFNEALRKFKSFATESTYETSVSGSIIGVLLRSFARIDSAATFAAFVPKLCEELTELLATDEALHEENPSRDLSYRLVLLMHAVECDGTVLLKYIPTILPVLDRALKLHCTSSLNRASEILSHILTSFCYISLNECRGSPNDYSTAPEKWLPVRDWGKGCSLQDANFNWHVPSAEEAECAQLLVNRYLKPEVERLKQWLSGERAMCRSRRLRCFTIMRAVLACSTFLPPSDEEPLNFYESQLAPASVKFANGVRYSVNLDGANLRVALTRLLVEVQARLLDDRTDDTRGLEMLIQVWDRVVVLRGGRSGPGLEARLRSFAALERALDGRGEVGGGAMGGAGALRLRMLVAEGVRLQEDARSDLALERGVTPSIMHALNALYDLSVHHYTVVRIQAQAHLYWILSHYSYIYRALVPKLVDLLEKGGDGEDWHDRHKGALCILLGPRCGPLIAKQDWEAVSKLWLAVLKSPLSEKASIIRLENAFSDTVHRNFPTMNTRLTVSEGAVRAAEALLARSAAPSNTVDPAVAVETERITSLRTEDVYTKMIEDIVAICETPNIQWRRLELAMQMLIRCPSLQTYYPPALVRFSLRSLLHENIVVRRLAIKLVQYVLKQRKRPIKKIKVDPYEIAGVPKKTSHVPGYREDLDWTLWSGEVPETDEEYEKPWLRNDNYGFYCWPEKLEVAAPSNEQVFSFNIPKEEMEAGERMIYEWFSDEENVTKLISFLIVEDKKGKDKFNSTKFSMFRLLFSQFGMEVSQRLLSEAKVCAASSQEASQRFAAEVAAAALRAPHYWPRDLARRMYAAALDIITAGLKAVTAETMEDWGTCLATGAEKLCVRRGAVVVRTLLDVCLPQDASGALDATAPTSFVVCARLYALHGVLSSLSWRAAPLATKILEQLEAANFTQHPFQNVRETVSSLLMTIFDTELVFPNGQLRGPSLKSFLDTVTPRLAPLYDENGDIVIRTAAALSTSSECGRSEEVVAPDLELGNPLVESVGAVGAVDPVGPVQVEVGRLSPIDDDAPEGDERETKTTGRAARVPALGEGLEAAMALAGDASLAHRENARAVNLLTTVFRACTGSTVRGVAGARGAHATLVAAACALAARGPAHDEVARAADGFLASLALALHSSEDFLHLLDHLEKLAVGRSWWARVACVDLAQPLIFYALPLLCERPDAAERTQRFALTLMRDSRLEVRQSAAKLLTGLMHCRALPDEDATLRGLMKSCRSKQLVERHCGVLGLCSYLSSRPYSLGPKLGEVLNELSRHTHASDPIPATIRTALADFRRTHHDDWPTHRQQLTEDELDLLADLTSPPTYCA